MMRPDGKWALADVNNQLWVVAMPPYRHRRVGERAQPVAAGQTAHRYRLDYFAWADEGQDDHLGDRFYVLPPFVRHD